MLQISLRPPTLLILKAAFFHNLDARLLMVPSISIHMLTPLMDVYLSEQAVPIQQHRITI